jgi:hypothetical protein
MSKSFKEWYENKQTYDVMNNRMVRDWIYDTFLKKRAGEKEKDRKKRFEKFLYITAKNIDAFKKIFGKQTSVYQSWQRNYVWKREFKDRTFLVISSIKGTSLEIIKEEEITWENMNNKKDAQIIIEFYTFLVGKLENYYKKQNIS